MASGPKIAPVQQAYIDASDVTVKIGKKSKQKSETKRKKTTINLCSSHTPYGIGVSHGVPVLTDVASYCNLVWLPPVSRLCHLCMNKENFLEGKR